MSTVISHLRALLAHEGDNLMLALARRRRVREQHGQLGPCGRAREPPREVPIWRRAPAVMSQTSPRDQGSRDLGVISA